MRYTLIACLSVVLFQLSSAQCSFQLDADIVADNSATYQIIVDGLDNSDLSTDQALCGVELHFDHPSVTNLGMSLTSPSGQTAFIVGPATTASSISAFVEWDIEFVPCSNPASPDSGFPDVWSNTNPWSNGVTNSGSYYPNGGCLEDFDTGSANGVWTLTVDDLGENNGGELFSVELVFCNGSGLACQICDTQVVDTDQESQFFCEGQEILFETDTYFSVTSDEATDSYIILVENGQIVEIITDETAIADLPAGIYELYGLAVPEGTNTNTFSDLATLIGALTDGSLCGDISDENRFINILEVGNVETFNETLCAGEPFEVGGTVLTAPVDTVLYTLSTNGTCETQFNVTLNVQESGLEIQQGDQNLDCGDELVLSASVINPNINYEWYTIDGSIISDSNTPIIIINQPGTYVLFGDEDCVAADSVVISPASGFDQVSIAVSSNDCSSNNATLSIETDINIDDFYWQGPGIDGSTSSNPMITQTGDYSVVVFSDDFDCDSIIVHQSFQSVTTAPVTLLKDGDLSCTNQSVNVFAETASQDLLGIEWVDEIGEFVGTGLSTQVTFPGTFTAMITYINGCTETETITVTEDVTLFSIAVTNTPLECSSQEGQLEVLTDGPVESIQWFGPFGFSSFDAVTTVNTVGTYRVIVTFEDGCELTTTATVDYNPVTSPVLTFGTTNIDCNNECGTISIDSGDDPNFCIQWFGPSGFEAFDRDPEICTPGRYRVRINETSDCESQVCFSEYFIFVIVDTLPPELIVDVVPLNCNNTETQLETSTDFSRIDNFIWTGPGIDASNENVESPIVDIAGLYNISGMGTNGCPFTFDVNVIEDLDPVVVTNDGAIFNTPCNGAFAELVVDSPDQIMQYTWSEPFQFGPTLFTSEPGVYSVTVTGENFCPTVANFTVTNDELFTLSVPSDTIGLGCQTSIGTTTVSLLDADPNSEAMITDLQATHTDGTFVSTTSVLPGSMGELTFALAGDYIITATLDNDCVLEYSINVDAAESVITPMMDIPDINCINLDEAPFAVLNATDYASIQWTLDDGTIVSEDATYVNVSPITPLNLSVVDVNGCSTSLPIAVSIDTITPTLELIENSLGDCQSELNGLTDANVTYAWSSNEGSMVTAADQQLVTVNALGLYTLMVESIDNGCIAIDSITVDTLEGLGELAVILDEPICGADFMNVMDVTVNGASVDNLGFVIMVDDAVVSTFPLEVFGEGSHSITVMNDGGCMTSSSFDVTLFESFTLSVPDTLLAIENEPFTIDLGIETTQSIDDFIFDWSGDPDIFEVGEATYNLPISGDFSVQVTDTNGCTGIEEFHISVNPANKVFVPNIFRVGGSDENGELSIFLSNPGEVSMSVFDRWGNMVFNDTGRDQLSWNGLLGSESVEQGVYVVMIDILFDTGDTLRQINDVTVIR